MHYALVHYPQIDCKPIDAIRRRYDPTAHVIAPHVTVLFPVPDRVGYEALADHIDCVLQDYSPFEMSLAGFHKSPDHWLLATVDEGAETIRAMYRALYTGLLEEFRVEGIAFTPHLGLGLFVKRGERYSPFDPRESAFDRERYDVALYAAQAAGVGGRALVETLSLAQVPDPVFEWAMGRRSKIPADVQVSGKRQFRLGG